MIKSGVYAAIIATTTALLLTKILFTAVIPNDQKKLPSLKESSRHSASIYGEDTWPENGYANLPAGSTHYYFIGPEHGPKIVFVHGISSPPPTIAIFLNKLAARGFRVLCYELYGTGYSDCPGVVYDDLLYINQLTGLLLSLNWTFTSIIGYSLGGAIAAGFVASFPSVIDKIVFIAPAGIMNKMPILSHLLKIPGLGKLFLHTVGAQVLIKRSAANHLPAYKGCDEVKQYNKMIEYHTRNNPGFIRAFGSTVINFGFNGHTEDFRAIGSSHAGRVMAIWGALDNVVHTSLSTLLVQLIPSLCLKIRDETSHSIVLEDSDYVTQQISQFLT